MKIDKNYNLIVSLEKELAFENAVKEQLEDIAENYSVTGGGKYMIQIPVVPRTLSILISAMYAKIDADTHVLNELKK